MQVTRAHEAGQLDGVTGIGVDPSAGLLWDQRGGHDPADMAFWGQIAGEPVSAGPSLIDKDKLRAFGVQPTDQGVDVTLARPDGPEGDDLGAVVLGNISDRDRVFMDIQSDVKRARLVHG